MLQVVNKFNTSLADTTDAGRGVISPGDSRPPIPEPLIAPSIGLYPAARLSIKQKRRRCIRMLETAIFRTSQRAPAHTNARGNDLFRS
jgi:hypothetical protein